MMKDRLKMHKMEYKPRMDPGDLALHWQPETTTSLIPWKDVNLIEVKVGLDILSSLLSRRKKHLNADEG